MNLETSGFFQQQANFVNFSLLICNLFADGNFQLIDIVYHPDAFDDRLLVSIDSNCPFQIPKTTQDITTNEKITIDRRGQRTDRILQLIFLPTNQLIAQFNKPLEKLFTFYRIFVFATSSNDQLNLNQIQPIASVNTSSSSLLMVHNTLSDTISEYILSKSSMQSVELSNSRLNSNQIFDSVFVDRSYGRNVVVFMIQDLICDSLKRIDYFLKASKAFAILYSEQLKTSFIDGFRWDCATFSVEHQRVRAVKRSFYSHYHFKFELVPDVEA